jgi:hypothetical protein
VMGRYVYNNELSPSYKSTTPTVFGAIFCSRP